LDSILPSVVSGYASERFFVSFHTVDCVVFYFVTNRRNGLSNVAIICSG
jgi:hypothetical protein